MIQLRGPPDPASKQRLDGCGRVDDNSLVVNSNQTAFSHIIEIGQRFHSQCVYIDRHICTCSKSGVAMPNLTCTCPWKQKQQKPSNQGRNDLRPHTSSPGLATVRMLKFVPKSATVCLLTLNLDRKCCHANRWRRHIFHPAR